MSDTPRTEAVNQYLRTRRDYTKTDHEVWMNHGIQIERELNAANAEIERLTAKVAQLYEGAEEQKQRIKRLEQAGDEAICPLEYAARVRIWTKAKEAKP